MEKMTKFNGTDQIDLEVEIQRQLDALGNDGFEEEENADETDADFQDCNFQVVYRFNLKVKG